MSAAEGEVMSAPMAARATGSRRPTFPTAWIVPAIAGIAGVVLLVGLYVGIVTWAQGLAHARDLLWSDRYFLAAIAGGFGLQIGLFVHVRRVVSRRARGSAAAATATGTGTSTVAMVACCAHHVADALPLLGLSGAAIFLNDYRIPLMSLGLAMNAVGVAVMVRLVIVHTRRSKEQAVAC